MLPIQCAAISNRACSGVTAVGKTLATSRHAQHHTHAPIVMQHHALTQCLPDVRGAHAASRGGAAIVLKKGWCHHIEEGSRRSKGEKPQPRTRLLCSRERACNEQVTSCSHARHLARHRWPREHRAGTKTALPTAVPRKRH